jgi:hypothetical protein
VDEAAGRRGVRARPQALRLPHHPRRRGRVDPARTGRRHRQRAQERAERRDVRGVVERRRVEAVDEELDVRELPVPGALVLKLLLKNGKPQTG